MSSSMSLRTTAPATTYDFTYTTFSTSLPPSRFSKPTAIPSIFSFNAGSSCTANSVSTASGATPLASDFPKNQPTGTKAACAISNDIEYNDHAFWDLYSCCKGMDLTAMGDPNLCTAQCAISVEDGQTWQEVAACLNKRVNVVVCKPAANDIKNGTTASQTRTSGAAMSSSATASLPAASTGAGNVVGVSHFGGSKTAVALYAVLAIGSFAGMML